ncbi:MAG: DUF563 domain-containing protein, partial [Synergistaceae bacterium]|nr:DUF563 domain-containing protein [Synergistaceae bacterium]
FTQEYKDMFDIVVANSGASLTGDNKIYCSRAHFRNAQLWEDGEKYIEQVFSENGYTSVYMEEMTLSEQIAALNSSREIAMMLGTLAHNLLFLRNEAAEVTIINKYCGGNGHQLLINQLSGASVTYVDAYVAPMPVGIGFGPYILRITEQFRNYCRDKGLKISDALEKSSSVKLKLGTKIWYYAKWIRNSILNNRNIFYLGTFQWGKALRRMREVTVGNKFYREIRKLYLSQQSGE